MTQHTPLAQDALSITPAPDLTPTPHVRLAALYGVVAAYGVTSSLVGITTVAAVAGEWFGALLPFLMAVSALSAMYGVMHSRLTGRRRFEFASTLALIAFLGCYSVAILARTAEDLDFSRAPAAWLPIAISVFPFARLIDLARGSK